MLQEFVPLEGTTHCGDATIHPELADDISSPNRKALHLLFTGRQHIFIFSVEANLIGILHGDPLKNYRNNASIECIECIAYNSKLNYLDVYTYQVSTYTVSMNVTLSIDEQTVARARKRAEALGKSLNQLIRDYLQRLAGGDDPEQSIDEFKRLSGRGHSRGWKFNRDEIHERP